MDIEGEPMLHRVIGRALRSYAYRLVVATTDAPEDDPVADLCRKLEIDVFRGSEEDVLDRYYRAAIMAEADTVIRLTGDNPLIDHQFIEMLLNLYGTGYYDYVTGKGFPLGLSAEVFSFGALEAAWNQSYEEPDREHVTAYIYRNPDMFRIAYLQSEPDYSQHRWTVDTPEDLEFVREVYKRLSEPFSWAEVIALLEREPELAQINQDVKQKRLGE